MRSHLAEAIAELSEREQLILSLYYREELTMKEVAEIVGVAISRVSQIIAAAIQKLRVSLDHLQDWPSSRTETRTTEIPTTETRTAETQPAETGAHRVPTK
jgi:predicted DNA-binding protein YlxM (UPF0122 family)